MKNFRRKLVGAATAFALLTTSALADLSYKSCDQGHVLAINGSLTSVLDRKVQKQLFMAALTKKDIDFVLLESQGGNFKSAIRTAELLLHNKDKIKAVVVGEKCFSACAYIFLSLLNRGVPTYVWDQSTILIHYPSTDKKEMVKFYEKYSSDKEIVDKALQISHTMVDYVIGQWLYFSKIHPIYPLTFKDKILEDFVEIDKEHLNKFNFKTPTYFSAKVGDFVDWVGNCKLTIGE